tara:strand:- start:2841 stop:3482 length:642 start_codon:yes stop_codon:yes gene_type:complete
MKFQRLTDRDGEILVKMARLIVTEHLTNITKNLDQNDAYNRAERYRIFEEKFGFNAGVFVTINDKSGLRGCIGFPLAVKKLSDALTDAAISASTKDPRFPSVAQNELNDLVFEVTVLTAPEEISTSSPDEIIQEIKIGRDGLIIEKDSQSGLLLPQVPVEYNWNVVDFLSHTCHKAGLPNDSWTDTDVKISKFQGVIFREISPNGEIIREKFQ